MTNHASRPIERISPATAQRGITLVIGLVILLVMTLTGLAAVRSVTLEERIVANERDRTLAFQAAEAAARDAIAWLEAQTGPIDPSADGESGVWESGSVGLTTAFDREFWDDTEHLRTYPLSAGLTEVDGVASQPKIAIEQLAFIPDDNDPATLAARRGVFYYRITTQGTGGTASARSLIQSFHRIRYF